MFVRVSVDRSRVRELIEQIDGAARAYRRMPADGYVSRRSARSGMVLDASCGVNGVWHVPNYADYQA